MPDTKNIYMVKIQEILTEVAHDSLLIEMAIDIQGLLY